MNSALKTSASEYWPLDKLKLWDRNPRSIKTDRFNELVERLKRQGQIKPLLVTKDGIVIGGNMRLRAMQQLGVDKAWVSVTDAKTDKEIFDLAITDNEEFGYYEQEQVAELALELGLDPIELNSYQLSLAPPTPLGQVLDQFGPEEIEEDEAPEVDNDNPPVSVPGEIYALGKHRLLCGSGTDEDDVNRLFGDQLIDLYLTDPPYNVDYEGGTGLKIMNDSMDDGAFLAFLADAYRRADEHMKTGASFYIFHADSEGYNFRAAIKEVNWMMKQCLIWEKQSMVMGRQDYQWKHEPILYGWKSGAAHAWYSDRKQTTLLKFDRPSRNAEHPTMKPLNILAYLIRNSSKSGDLVFDNFLGSGSTLIACQETGRTCYGAELDPKYCDVIRKRYWKHTTGDEEGWQDGTATAA